MSEIEDFFKDKRLDWISKVFDFMNAGLVITDATKEDNPIIYANPTFYDMTEYDEEDVIGKNCRFLQGPDTDQKIIQKIRDAVKNKRREKFILKNYTKDGTPFWNELFIAPIFDDNGTVTNYVGIQHDVTEEMAYEL